MRTLIAILLVGYAMCVAQGNPTSDKYCMGNRDDLATCSSCYNTSLGTIGVKQLTAAGDVCEAATNSVTGCKYYNPTMVTAQAVTDCRECNSLTWFNVIGDTANSVTCSGTAIDTTNCANPVANCLQSMCWKTNAAGTYAPFCRKCNINYKPNNTSTLATGLGYATCTGSPIQNCSYASPTDAAQCEECAANFLVAANGQSCVSNSTAGCRKLSAGGNWCGECKNNYYFNLLVCTIGYTAPTTTTTTTGAKMIAFSAIIGAILVFFN